VTTANGKVQANGIEIAYEESGDPQGPPLLLINGLGGQLVAWSQEFLDRLAARGYRVITFDNRDAGLSTHLADAGYPNIIGMLAQMASAKPLYSLEDMADDAAGLLDTLGIESVHVFGVSMGGMIAQTFAISHPQRTSSLCSVMSRSGQPGTGLPTGEAMRVLLQPPPKEREKAIAQSLESTRAISSPGFPFDEERALARATLAYDRAHDPAGTARQLAAVIGQRDRTDDLGRVEVPTLVIHGTADPLVQPDGGEATAAAVPGSELIMIDGMGHDLPLEVLDQVVDALAANIAKGEASR
jgi:pimeloyl-ACP methyl ester carboxylesterase